MRFKFLIIHSCLSLSSVTKANNKTRHYYHRYTLARLKRCEDLARSRMREIGRRVARTRTYNTRRLRAYVGDGSSCKVKMIRASD